MSRFVRQIALLLILSVMANVQAWALSLESEFAHQDSVESLHVLIEQVTPQQQDLHDCSLAGHHCCHAINHLLGQVSSDFILSPLKTENSVLLHAPGNSPTIAPNSIFHPPRTPDLA